MKALPSSLSEGIDHISLVRVMLVVNGQSILTNVNGLEKQSEEGVSLLAPHGHCAAAYAGG